MTIAIHRGHQAVIYRKLAEIHSQKLAAMDQEQKKQDLVDFLRTIQRPDYPHDAIDEESSLIEAGLIDSLALLQIVSYLEETYSIDFRERGIDPGDLRSVSSILELIARESNP